MGKHRTVWTALTATISMLSLTGCSTSPKHLSTSTSGNDTNQVAHSGGVPTNVTNTLSESTSNQTENATSTDGTASPFSPQITEAMNYVKQNTDLRPLFAPTAPLTMQKQSVSVTANASQGQDGSLPHYTVALIGTDSKYSMNNPALSTINNIIAVYRGLEFASTDDAAARMNQMLGNTAGQPSVVDLGHEVEGHQYVAGSNHSNLIQWQSGTWTMQVFGGSIAQDVQLSRQVVDYVGSHTLPSSKGILAINMNSTHPDAQTGWVTGTVEYSVESSEPMTVLTMTSSMKEFK